MAFADTYRRQVALLLRTLPFIAKEKCFALKGGTAINLFVRDLPRLSVDIDLTYLPVYGRKKSLGAIDKAMRRIEAGIKKGIQTSRVTSTVQEGAVNALRSAFIVYLISHHRPMGEVLGGAPKPIDDAFIAEFEGMTDEPVTKEELAEARRALVATIVGKMPAKHKRFLISFEAGERTSASRS